VLQRVRPGRGAPRCQSWQSPCRALRRAAQAGHPHHPHRCRPLPPRLHPRLRRLHVHMPGIFPVLLPLWRPRCPAASAASSASWPAGPQLSRRGRSRSATSPNEREREGQTPPRHRARTRGRGRPTDFPSGVLWAAPTSPSTARAVSTARPAHRRRGADHMAPRPRGHRPSAATRGVELGTSDPPGGIDRAPGWFQAPRGLPLVRILREGAD
jgi:hypothetical protein